MEGVCVGGCYTFNYDILVYGFVWFVVSANKEKIKQIKRVFLFLNLGGTLAGGNYFY